MANLVMDVSGYQPDTVSFFQAAKNAGVKAVIVKLTQGSADGDAYVNPKAQAQINNARSVGLLVHGYHYARFNGNQDARNEAKWFTDHAKKFGLGPESVLALDIEDKANAKYATSDSNAFLQAVKDAGYPKVDIYSMASWFWQGRLDAAQLIAKNKWVANYGVSQPGVDNVGTWQWTDNYKIAGTGVDMSYDFSGFYTNADTSANEPKPVTPAPKPVNQKTTWTDNLGDTWHAEEGKFISNTALHLRWGARPSASTIAVLPAGSVIKYDAWSRGNEFVYVRQPRGNGYGYVAVRNARTGEAYGKFE
ncbi:GH25 family lysozyme [Limosilactobacillus sp. WILCCON 0053]|uniref:GH25 family lysozyme n=1 Tax=Limosilactobacillus allomucosae TaxID=3142938 RepID=UPI0032637240